MGLFKKKDPISERAKSLNQQIAALQAEIERLSDEPAEDESPEPRKPSKPFGKSAAAAAPEKPQSTSQQPKLRSTALPGRELARRAGKAQRSAPEPVFEQVVQPPAAEPPQPASTAHYNDLGVRKYDLASLWKRWQAQFRGPATNNPKLVNYLAAGSIQGLRPLRYEKRVARNRFIVFVLALLAALWGLIAIWFKHS